MHRGFIKIHRCITDSWIYQDERYLKAWIAILFEVNHKPGKVVIHGELLECGRGESLNSLSTWTEKFGRGWTIDKVRKFFSLLVNDEKITTEGLRKTTRLKVCNYDTYQNQSQAEPEQKPEQNPQKPQAEPEQIPTNKNVKNIYTHNSAGAPYYSAEVKAYPNDPQEVIEEAKKINYLMSREEAESFIAKYRITGWTYSNQPIRHWPSLLTMWRSNQRPEHRQRAIDEAKGSIRIQKTQQDYDEFEKQFMSDKKLSTEEVNAILEGIDE